MYFNRGITNWKSNRSSFVKANPSDSQLRLTLLFSKLIVGCMTKNWSTHSGNKTTVTSIRESLLRRWSLSHKQMCLLKRIGEGRKPVTELESYAEMWMLPVIYSSAAKYLSSCETSSSIWSLSDRRLSETVIPSYVSNLKIPSMNRLIRWPEIVDEKMFFSRASHCPSLPYDLI